MKARHVPARFDETPCRKKLGKTGLRCTKAEGHKRTDKNPLGHLCASIGMGTTYSENRVDLRTMNEKEASNHMVNLSDRGGEVYASFSAKRG